MKWKQTALTAVAALSLGLSAAAAADDHRGRDYRGGKGHKYSAPRHVDRKYRGDQRRHRSNWRAPKHRDHKRFAKKHRRDHAYRDGYRPRAKHWRQHKRWDQRRHARKHWRQHNRWDQRRHARKHWRQHDRRRHWNPNYYGSGYGGYESSAFTLWFDGIGLSVAESHYDD